MSGRQLRRAIAHFFNYLFAPGICLACGSAIADATSLCDACRAQLWRVPNPCSYCGQPNPGAAAACAACLHNPPRWQRLIAPLQYRGLTRDYLIQLKFSEATWLAKTLGQQCLGSLRASAPRPEVLLPVPLHRERLLERGYNQAREIASVWSAALEIPVDRKALTRTRATQSQSGLSASQRSQNVAGVFSYSPGKAYRHVAVVDDIVTTGSTVTEITRTLHRAGVEYVEIWAIARAYRK